MKKLYVLGTTILLISGLLIWGVGPAMAQDGYKKITTPFTTEEGDFGHRIPSGSIIYHLPDGITEVRGQDNARVLIAQDSEASLIATPVGPMRATHIYHIPSGSRIDVKGNTSRVYEGQTRILTVVSQVGDTKTPIPSYDGWIESSDDWSVAAIDWFRAYWNAPSAPPSPGDTVVDFLFNGIEPDDGTKIIQPVLEWNYGGSDRWTGAAWAVWNGGSYRATAINVSTGDSIRGTLDWGGTYSGYWDVNFYDSSTGQTSAFSTNAISTDENLAVFCALEGYDVVDDGDAPGDTTFDSMTFEHDSSSVDITWVENVRSGTGLTGLSVTIYSDSKVKLNTAN